MTPTVTVLLAVNDGVPVAVGSLDLANPATKGWETAALLREIADEIEATDPPFEIKVV